MAKLFLNWAYSNFQFSIYSLRNHFFAQWAEKVAMTGMFGQNQIF